MNIILHKFMLLPKPKKWLIASGLTFATSFLIWYCVKIRRGKKKVSYKPANQLIRDEFVEFDVNRVQKSDNPTNASPPNQNQWNYTYIIIVQVIIKQLLDNSSRKRNVNENYKNYLIQILDLKDLQNYYSLKKLEIKKKIEKYCNKMIHVRGDGNCFYTSFGYQLLRIVIYQYSDEEFEAFLKKNFSIPFKIQLKNEIFENAEKQRILLNYYKDRIIYIRNLEKYYKQNENYSSELMRHFRAHEHKDDLDGYFQPLTILFLRNLCKEIVENCEEGQNVLDKENLLIWEEECNSNEQVIAILAKYFQLYYSNILWISFDLIIDFLFVFYIRN